MQTPKQNKSSNQVQPSQVRHDHNPSKDQIETQTEWTGRITEMGSDAGVLYIEVVVGDHRTIFEYSDAQASDSAPSSLASSGPEASGLASSSLALSDLPVLSQLKRGDLVKIRVASLGSKSIVGLQILGEPTCESWSPLGDSIRWRRPVAIPSRMSRLWQRQKILTAIRETLELDGFLEVETPLLVKGTCPDTEIESIRAGEGYLVTSTEYQIKRLMVGGFEKVFTLTKNFRAGDRGRYHSTEFTMLEWARAYVDPNNPMKPIEEDTIKLIRCAFKKLYPGEKTLKYNGSDIDILDQNWERLSVREAFRVYLGLTDLADFSLEALRSAMDRAGLKMPEPFKSGNESQQTHEQKTDPIDDKHFVLSYLLDKVQRHLGVKTPTFLCEWPAFMTSSAQLNSADPHTADRSELYIAGIEISDGFPFLRDAQAQKRFFARELARRSEEGKTAVVLDDLYLQTLAEGIPPGAGMALGVDRLVMVLTGSSQLSDVQAFSWDEI